MKLNAIERDILLGAVADLVELQATEMPPGYGEGDLKRAILNVQEGLVRCDPSKWTRGPMDDAAFRVAVSRAYARLERWGLVTRERMAYGGGERCTHLAPTEAGIELAKELAEQAGAGDG